MKCWLLVMVLIRAKTTGLLRTGTVHVLAHNKLIIYSYTTAMAIVGDDGAIC